MQESQLPKQFDPKGVENKWYDTWMKNDCFRPVKRSDKGTFTTLMPPPNVTGRLHMGHALNHTIQDVLTRLKRMQGYETLWIPGQDHAGIATQAKVEQKLYQEEGKTKHDIGREEFLKRVWEWRNEYGDHIIDQVKKLGDSCDWNYFTFTMDEIPNKAVKKFFVDLYNEGLIYQADYIINWDPVLQSAISDAEVEHKEVNGNFYHIKYQVKGTDEYLEIATTRPETLFGDTAVAVNPNDDRYERLIGKKVIIPLCEREVSIIADTHVDMETGTGCLKVTPGHDFNDFEIGKRNELEIINLINDDGSFNENAQPIQGLKSKEARKETVRLLKEQNLLLKVESHKHQVGHGQRSDEVIEPRVSKQWFLDTEKMAKRSVEAIENDQARFFPKGWENTYFAYQKNPRPWCLSRQLWWGHQIPVYYCQEGSCDNTWASEQVPGTCPKCHSDNFKQDPDVLDTWFSSGLYPLNTLGWPDQEAMSEKGFERFYPATTLVTAFDIIFFWVARMMMMCDKATGKSPLNDIYIHAIVRDKDGKKMSKSLGNVIDPLEMIDQYGCDALRFTLAISSGYNRNINLDPEKIEGYRNFVNKVWNAFRFIHPHLDNASEKGFELSELHHHEKWILCELNAVVKEVTEGFEQYRFDEACNTIYQFVYDKFCSWFIEVSKGVLNSQNESLRIQRANVLKYCFRQITKLLHPVTPFITEELWQNLKNEDEDLLIVQQWPEFTEQHQFADDVQNMNYFMEIVSAIRNLRNTVNVKPNEEVEIKLFTDDEKLAKYLYQSRGFFKELAKVKAGSIKDKNGTRPAKSVMKATTHTDIFLPLEGVINIDEYKEKLQRDLKKVEAEFLKVDKKLKNPKFMDNAPDDVVVQVKEKAQGLGEQLNSIKDSLQSL